MLEEVGKPCVRQGQDLRRLARGVGPVHDVCLLLGAAKGTCESGLPLAQADSGTLLNMLLLKTQSLDEYEFSAALVLVTGKLTESGMPSFIFQQGVTVTHVLPLSTTPK